MTLIRCEGAEARVVVDEWTEVEDGAPVPPGADATVSLERWTREAETLRARSARIGVRVPNDADPDEVGPLLDGVSLVTVDFPQFTDGRGYTIARILRERHGYAGELRAVGHVLRDQLFYMARCGFDGFELARHQDVGDALNAFRDFSVTYQPAADHAEPIWRRR